MSILTDQDREALRAAAAMFGTPTWQHHIYVTFGGITKQSFSASFHDWCPCCGGYAEHIGAEHNGECERMYDCELCGRYSYDVTVHRTELVWCTSEHESEDHVHGVSHTHLKPHRLLCDRIHFAIKDDHTIQDALECMHKVSAADKVKPNVVLLMLQWCADNGNRQLHEDICCSQAAKSVSLKDLYPSHQQLVDASL